MRPAFAVESIHAYLKLLNGTVLDDSLIIICISLLLGLRICLYPGSRSDSLKELYRLLYLGLVVSVTAVRPIVKA